MKSKSDREFIIEVNAKVEEHERRIRAHKVELLTSIGKLEFDLKELIKDKTNLLMTEIQKAHKRLEKYYVTHGEFRPVKAIIYGMVSCILFGVLGAIGALLLKGVK